jgi:histidine triad (HIT) family protein
MANPRLLAPGSYTAAANSTDSDGNASVATIAFQVLPLAINDINPQAPVHVLILPKRHIATLNDLGPDDDGLMGDVVRRAAIIAAEKGIAAPGYRTLFNTNRDAGQTVFHIHLHLLGGRTLGPLA